MAAILDKFGLLGNDKPAHDMIRAPVTNTRNAVVGERRPAEALRDAMIPSAKIFARGISNLTMGGHAPPSKPASAS